MLPQLAVGGETPTPRKEMADSAMMKPPTFSEAATMIGASEFGIRWTQHDAPAVCAEGARGDARSRGSAATGTGRARGAP